MSLFTSCTPVYSVMHVMCDISVTMSGISGSRNLGFLAPGKTVGQLNAGNERNVDNLG